MCHAPGLHQQRGSHGRRYLHADQLQALPEVVAVHRGRRVCGVRTPSRSLLPRRSRLGVSPRTSALARRAGVAGSHGAQPEVGAQLVVQLCLAHVLLELRRQLLHRGRLAVRRSGGGLTPRRPAVAAPAPAAATRSWRRGARVGLPRGGVWLVLAGAVGRLPCTRLCVHRRGTAARRGSLGFGATVACCGTCAGARSSAGARTGIARRSHARTPVCGVAGFAFVCVLHAQLLQQELVVHDARPRRVQRRQQAAQRVRVERLGQVVLQFRVETHTDTQRQARQRSLKVTRRHAALASGVVVCEPRPQVNATVNGCGRKVLDGAWDVQAEGVDVFLNFTTVTCSIVTAVTRAVVASIRLGFRRRKHGVQHSPDFGHLVDAQHVVQLQEAFEGERIIVGQVCQHRLALR